jgi:hypothetical protein
MYPITEMFIASHDNMEFLQKILVLNYELPLQQEFQQFIPQILGVKCIIQVISVLHLKFSTDFLGVETPKIL